ncbi:hypothetical protein GOZ78_07710 [Agrobacterium vitis]|uniref:Uncharacterized protein n=1 Tax=Agrobacterium vitis TaxID=373 RepID=A0ABD6G6C9_AGRVI|nr:hypothetical protein [Agrobacterium vitis]MUO80143.1 hypothetical protein [Agrobacterium vitis]MUO97344.1 hypothetical protein [Agrobacterium vitis]MUP03739.1 hypothetical protein [Agrobacterium vitis]MUZ82579.1 hypothetical protein [Agrobacterium vitis]MVA09920.1 hypothetical protein [Agrobacterium vitis]
MTQASLPGQQMTDPEPPMQFGARSLHKSVYSHSCNLQIPWDLKSYATVAAGRSMLSNCPSILHLIMLAYTHDELAPTLPAERATLDASVYCVFSNGEKRCAVIAFQLHSLLMPILV